MDSKHPYMQEHKILNGVSTYEDTNEYLIKIKTRTEDGIFGSCSNKDTAIEIMQRVGKDELRLLRKTTDKTWTITDSHYDEKNMTYTITKQTLGRVVNGPIKIYSTVYIEEVPRVFKSKYTHDMIVDGPYPSLAAELKAHPKTFKDAEYDYE